VTNSHSLAAKVIEELELDMKESMDDSEETLERCWGIIMVCEQLERW
jgi:hypothetical protein